MFLTGTHVLRSSTGFRKALVVAAATLALAVPDEAAAAKKTAFNVLPINFTSVVVNDGQLVANGLIGNTPFQVPLILAPGVIPDGATCPILDLRLGPITLSLLGLNVDTSPICLEITARDGGGLLGDLLCSIANLLNDGTPLADVLAGLSADQATRLARGLTTVLNQVFVPISSSDALVNASCNILNLAVGPVNLTILGLNVRLDDCSDGPVTVDITATPGGGLLGNLLCNLDGQLTGRNPKPSNAALNTLRKIVRIIGGLIS